MIIGYARVSTDDQNLILQVLALQAAGCTSIYTDQGVSGSQRMPPGLDKALHHLKPGGKLVVWRLDRLGRSLIHLVQLMDMLGRSDIRFQSVTENIDTGSFGGRLVFHIMAALAEFERSLISERTRAGMYAARSQGRPLGRKLSLTTEQCVEANTLAERYGWDLHRLAEHYGIHPRTLARRLAHQRNQTDAAPSLEIVCQEVSRSS